MPIITTSGINKNNTFTISKNIPTTNRQNKIIAIPNTILNVISMITNSQIKTQIHSVFLRVQIYEFYDFCGYFFKKVAKIR